MTTDPDPSDPGWVFEDCPECETTLRICWPPDNPDSVDLRCRWCENDVEIERDG